MVPDQDTIYIRHLSGEKHWFLARHDTVTPMASGHMLTRGHVLTGAVVKRVVRGFLA